MGIKGLWSEVRPICRQSHLSNFRGQRVAVDMYVWLHRGIIGSVQLSSYADAEAFVECMERSSEGGNAEASVRLSTKFLQFVVNRVELMLKCGVHPVFVFDGAPIPMKQGTEKERQAHRALRLAESVQVLKDKSLSNPRARQEAAQLLEKGIDITTELAHAVIQVLQERQLECIVAPYEADAQLAYLCKEGYVQAVISEDSDLIAYHCPCLIAKLDGYGNCEVLLAQDVTRCQNFYGLSYESFLIGCILSGCDYLPSLRHIGVKKAFRLVSQATSVPSIMHNLQVKFGFSREELDDYESRLQKAFYCFAHHFVYDPIRKEVVHLTPLPEGIPLKTNILGEAMPKDIAQKVCGECLYDPNTHLLYRGSYQYCVEEYWKNLRGGQLLLKTFSGFQDMQSPRVILPLGQNDTDTMERRSSPTTTTTLFSSPLQKLCEATGFCERTNHTSRVVRSKYFTNGRWKVEDWESDESENTPTPTLTTTTITLSTETTVSAAKTAATFVEEEMEASSEGVLDIRSAVRRGLGSNSSPLDAQSSMTAKQESPGLLDEMWSLSSPVASPSVTLPSETVHTSNIDDSQNQREKNGCPFGYLQCGRRHSIFELCFKGKNWVSSVSSCGGDGTNNNNNNNNNNNTVSIDNINGNSSSDKSGMSCGEDNLFHSFSKREIGGKRALEPSAPVSFRRGFRPPASTSDIPISTSSCGNHMAPAAKRRMLSSTEPALQLMNRFNRGGLKDTALDLKTQDISNGNHSSSSSSGGNKVVAAEIFEKLAYTRR